MLRFALPPRAEPELDVGLGCMCVQLPVGHPAEPEKLQDEGKPECAVHEGLKEPVHGGADKVEPWSFL